MKEAGQRLTPEFIDHQTERGFHELPTRERHLIAEMYQVYMPAREANDRSLQRIWDRFAQEQSLSQEGQEGAASTRFSKEANADGPDAPVPGSFLRPQQPQPRRIRRSFWSRLSGGLAVAVVVIIILSWVLLTHASPMGNPQGAYGVTLTLGGGPQTSNTVVFLVKSSDESGQYLATLSYDTYNGHAWSNSAISSLQLPANKRLPSEASLVHLVTQQIILINPPGELQPYVFVAGQIASINRPSTMLIDKKTGKPIAVLLNDDQPLTKGEQYTVQSYVSSADIAELRSIPLPADAPANYYNPAILRTYLQLPNNLDPRILAKAKQVTAGAKSMYDMAVDLENYLRTNFAYDINVDLPQGAEATSWLLFQSNHRAFCNYFATAMTVMARELGIPARVVVGYSSGTYDVETHEWMVHGSDAHAWTQIYFAGYGWINFEPSPGFSSSVRPL